MSNQDAVDLIFAYLPSFIFTRRTKHSSDAKPPVVTKTWHGALHTHTFAYAALFHPEIFFLLFHTNKNLFVIQDLVQVLPRSSAHLVNIILTLFFS